MGLKRLNWNKLYSEVSNLAEMNHNYEDFVCATLNNIKEMVCAERASYLCCIHDFQNKCYNVTGISVPENKSLYSKNTISDKLSIINEELIIDNQKERVFYKTIDTKDGKRTVLVYQIFFEINKSQHILVITLNNEQKIDPKKFKTQKRISIKFINLFAHIATSLYLSNIEKSDNARHHIIDKILSTSGYLCDVTSKLGNIWCDLFNADAARFWIYNRKFDELDLLDVYCNNCREIISKVENQLPMDSFSGASLKQKKPYKAWTDGSYLGLSDEAKKRLNKDNLCELWPHFMCIPLIIPTIEKDTGNEKNFFGVLDLHWAEKPIISHNDDRIKFLGGLTSQVIIGSQVTERRRVVEKLNQIALELVSPTELKQLEEKKKEYLNSLGDIILVALHANCLSIFESDESYEKMICSVTTGIQTDKSLDKISYNAGEGATGEVLKNNLPVLLSNVRDYEYYRGVFEETRTINPTDDRDPFIAVPIPGINKNKPSGVIRVLERTCHVNPNLLQNFSFFDLEILQLIANQISPIFQMIKLQSHRQRFVERTAHQLIQPLTGVVAYTSNIVDGVYGSITNNKIEEKCKYIRYMSRSAASMMRSCVWATGVTDFSFLSKVSRSPKRLKKWIIERIIDIQPIRMHENIQIQYDEDKQAPDSLYFIVDELYFDQCIQSILFNAVKYSYPETIIEVSAKKDQTNLIVSVKSCGVPIAQEERGSIFQDRQRGKSAENYDKIGTGQGLFITKQIMEGFKGSVSLLNISKIIHNVNPPTGMPPAEENTFVLTLPEAFNE